MDFSDCLVAYFSKYSEVCAVGPANIWLKNQLLDGVDGGFTKNLLTGEQTSIYDAAQTEGADRRGLRRRGLKWCGLRAPLALAATAT